MVLSTDTAIATVMDIELTMSQCFEERENLLVDRKAWGGYFENNAQAICIKVK